MSNRLFTLIDPDTKDLRYVFDLEHIGLIVRDLENPKSFKAIIDGYGQTFNWASQEMRDTVVTWLMQAKIDYINSLESDVPADNANEYTK